MGYLYRKACTARGKRVKELKVIFEDNHILIVEKPFNILSQSDRTEDEDMLSILKKDLKVRYNKPGNVYLGLVHRLDRPAGGLMVFAKTSKAAGRLSELIRNKTFGKTYLAVVNGVTNSTKGRLTHYLKKDNIVNTVEAINKPRQGYKEAILEYEVSESIKRYSLIKINLITGRPHQIRVQMGAVGNSLYGDVKYGNAGEKGKQLALWSTRLEFIHPVRKEILVYTLKPHNVEPWDLFQIEKHFGDDKYATFR